MSESEADLFSRLRELDDPEWLEWPQHYDRSGTGVHFGVLAARLEADFAARCTAEQDTQDSSEYGRVVVPGDATVCGTRIVVCVSKFGSLALVCADNPGAFLGTDDAPVDLGLSAGHADMESFDLAQPAHLFCLSNAIDEVVADLG
ncbi:hypothetical protein [Streptomyces sp. NPDC056464]|uniref:hypothetical protein n=1 Tax=Streptomyces sp. NPDC056464 TaxID=3345828 RepID=UPI00367BA55E